MCKPPYFKFYKSYKIYRNSFLSNAEYELAISIKKYLFNYGAAYATVEVNKEVDIPGVGKRYIDFVVTWGTETIWIEYNGYQHIGLVNDPKKYPSDVEALKQGLQTNDRLESQKYRDLKLKEYAEQLGISLIVYQTPYSDLKGTKAFNDDLLSYRSVKIDMKNAFYKPCYIYNNNRRNYA
jgi:hypothetical protein